MNCAKCAPEVETGDMVLEHEPEVQTGTIRICRAGANTAASLREACENSVTAAAQRPLPWNCPWLNRKLPRSAAPPRRPAFSSAAGAGFFADGDALLMQFLAEDLDLSLIEIENPLRRICSPTGRERERVQSARRRTRA